MKRRLYKLDEGFTLIEIVLVLAIAAMLIVIVFIAFQGAQHSRRDAQRRRDFGLIQAAFEQYASTNDGDYPADNNNGPVDTPTSTFRQTYIYSIHLNDPYDNNGNYHQYIFEDVYTNGPVDSTGMTICSSPDQIGTVYYKKSGKQIWMRMCIESGKLDYSNM